MGDFFSFNKIKCQDTLSKKTKVVIGLVREFNSNHFIKKNMRNNNGDFNKKPNYPSHIYTERIDRDNYSMELLRWKESVSKRVVLMLHGGGYVERFKSYHRTMAGLYSEVGKGMSVLSIDYRVAPCDPFPAALTDSLDAYEWLLEKGYKSENIILGGDSAGGGLALALCHKLREKNMSLPSGLVLMSPWTDLTLSGESYKEKADIDPIFGNGNSDLMNNNPYADKENLKNPLVSPLFGEYEGFPPMLIQVGSDEMLYDDGYVLAKKVKDAGVRVRFSEYENMFHVFQAAATMIPESKKAWSEVGKFLEEIG